MLESQALHLHLPSFLGTAQAANSMLIAPHSFADSRMLRILSSGIKQASPVFMQDAFGIAFSFRCTWPHTRCQQKDLSAHVRQYGAQADQITTSQQTAQQEDRKPLQSPNTRGRLPTWQARKSHHGRFRG